MNEDVPYGKLLVVDDEPHIRKIIKMALSTRVAEIFLAANAEEGLEIVKNENIDLVISDIQMPGMNGDLFLKKVKEEQPQITFLMITAHGDMDTVIQVMRYGASDFLAKPFNNNDLRSSVQKLLVEQKKSADTVHTLSVEKAADGVIGKSRLFTQAFERAVTAAQSDSSILILGESGTGKEVFAKTIHSHSPRSNKPFISLNCGAIPENLIESELFGYMEGAFTGANCNKPGKFELAEGGTIFLDEIGEMPIILQVKLLRVLQERMVDRVGGGESISVDFRLIAATNRNLVEEVAKGTFREDLYYRLNVVPVSLPTLSERGDDVVLLADYFLQNFNTRYSVNYSLTERIRNQLKGYHWPGNIRELENVIERAVVLGDQKELVLDILPAQKEVTGIKEKKRSLEKDEIIKALDSCRWNKTKTAEYLGISRRSLLYKVKEFQIS